jgi:hypothetical protein
VGGGARALSRYAVWGAAISPQRASRS